MTNNNTGLRGTLVVLVPTNDGLIAAADTRSTFDGQYYDIAKKLLRTDRKDIVFAVTGYSKIFPDPPPESRIDQWLRNTTPLFDSETIVDRVLRTTPFEHVNNDLLSKTFFALGESIIKVSHEIPNHPCLQLGSGIFTVVIGQFLHEERLSIAAWLTISIGVDGRLHSQSNIEKFSTNDSGKIRTYGQSDYWHRHVWKGEGRRFFPATFQSTFQSARMIGNLDAKGGALIAHSQIDATAKMTERIATDTGVGGAINVLLVDGKKDLKEAWLQQGRDF